MQPARLNGIWPQGVKVTELVDRPLWAFWGGFKWNFATVPRVMSKHAHFPPHQRDVPSFPGRHRKLSRSCCPNLRRIYWTFNDIFCNFSTSILWNDKIAVLSPTRSLSGVSTIRKLPPERNPIKPEGGVRNNYNKIHGNYAKLKIQNSHT